MFMKQEHLENLRCRKLTSVLSAVFACAVLAVAARADNPNIVVNGSFETTQIPWQQQFVTLASGSNLIANWIVSGSGVSTPVPDVIDVISCYWEAQDGQQSLDLNGYEQAGAVTQTLATIPGLTYQVSFWMSGNPNGIPGIRTMTVTIGGQTQTFTFDTSTAGATWGLINTVPNQPVYGYINMGWVQHTFNYTATGTSTDLTFASAMPGASYGPVLDNVSVTALDTFSWSGVLPPIQPDGSSVFKAGSTIPVKFMLTGPDSGITDLEADLSYAPITDSEVGHKRHAVSNVNTGDEFLYDPSGGQYIYNWNTSDISPGSYRLFIDLGDGLDRTVDITLK